MMELQKLINRALDLRNQYDKKERQLYGLPSTDEEIAQGFLGDVNNLVKLVKAEHGKGEIANSTEKLGSQLSHCLWSVIVLAKMHEINLEQSFMETMDKLENHLLETQE
jgi:NTP pyrophosphatase (non-canonical NTP hydrolase)